MTGMKSKVSVNISTGVSTQTKDTEEEKAQLRKTLSELFVSEPIEHGQRFDDNRRWCTTCSGIGEIKNSTKREPFWKKVCAKCMSIWPEYDNEIAGEEQLFDTEDDSTDLNK